MNQKPHLIHVGNNEYVNAARVLVTMSPKSILVKRMLKQAAQDGILLDFTLAAATRGVILMDNGVLIRIPLRPVDIARIMDETDAP